MRETTVASLCTLLVMVLASGCSPSNAGNAGHGEPASQAPGSAPASEAVPVVVFSPAGQPRAAVTVDLARTRPQIQQGLMYRKHLPPDHGMLFLMRQERIHSFWMRNTLISLDMIFIGKDMTVAGVVANTTPLTDDSRSIDKPSYYVLEVNGGWAAAHHVGPGTPVRFQNVRE